MYHLWFICSLTRAVRTGGVDFTSTPGPNMLPWHISPCSRAKHAPTHKAVIVSCTTSCFHSGVVVVVWSSYFAGLLFNVTYAAKTICVSDFRREVRGHHTDKVKSYSVIHYTLLSVYIPGGPQRLFVVCSKSFWQPTFMTHLEKYPPLLPQYLEKWIHRWCWCSAEVAYWLPEASIIMPVFCFWLRKPECSDVTSLKLSMKLTCAFTQVLL